MHMCAVSFIISALIALQVDLCSAAISTLSLVTASNGSSLCAVDSSQYIVSVNDIVGFPPGVPDVVRCAYHCQSTSCVGFNYYAYGPLGASCLYYDHDPPNCTTTLHYCSFYENLIHRGNESLPCAVERDIDECLSNNGGCSGNADCTNTIGSFSCACHNGFTGNGFTCTAIVYPLCEMTEIDLIIAVDTAYKPTRSAWQAVLTYVKNVISGFKVGPTGVHVAIVAYGYNVANVVIPFNQYSTVQALQMAVNNLELTSETWVSYVAVYQQALSHFMSSSARSSAKKKLLILSNNNVADASSALVTHTMPLLLIGARPLGVGIFPPGEISSSMLAGFSYYCNCQIVYDYSLLSTLVTSSIDYLCA